MKNFFIKTIDCSENLKDDTNMQYIILETLLKMYSL